MRNEAPNFESPEFDKEFDGVDGSVESSGERDMVEIRDTGNTGLEGVEDEPDIGRAEKMRTATEAVAALAREAFKNKKAQVGDTFEWQS